MSEDYAAILREGATLDWTYTDTTTRLHALAEGQPDVDEWRYEGVKFACGRTPKGGLAWVPGIFSRMYMPRCALCCDRTGLPRGVGSPKNDDACRLILGMPVGSAP